MVMPWTPNHKLPLHHCGDCTGTEWHCFCEVFWVSVKALHKIKFYLSIILRSLKLDKYPARKTHILSSVYLPTIQVAKGLCHANSKTQHDVVCILWTDPSHVTLWDPRGLALTNSLHPKNGMVPDRLPSLMGGPQLQSTRFKFCSAIAALDMMAHRKCEGVHIPSKPLFSQRMFALASK